MPFTPNWFVYLEQQTLGLFGLWLASTCVCACVCACVCVCVCVAGGVCSAPAMITHLGSTAAGARLMFPCIDISLSFCLLMWHHLPRQICYRKNKFWPKKGFDLRTGGLCSVCVCVRVCVCGGRGWMCVPEENLPLRRWGLDLNKLPTWDGLWLYV